MSISFHFSQRKVVMSTSSKVQMSTFDFLGSCHDRGSSDEFEGSGPLRGHRAGTQAHHGAIGCGAVAGRVSAACQALAPGSARSGYRWHHFLAPRCAK